MSIQVKVDGNWLATIGAWGDLTWGHNADGGCEDASWQMNLPPRFSHPSLVRGKLVQIMVGPHPVWTGVLTEPDPDNDWTCNAVGLSTLAQNGFFAFDSSLNVSYTPDVAIDKAIIEDIGWTRPASLSSSAYSPSTSTDDLLYLGALLDAWSDSVGKRWGVDAFGQVYAKADPTVPDWYLTPGTGRFGLADDDYVSDIYLRYVASGGSYATAQVGDPTARGQFGRRAYGVDATMLGTLTVGGAQSIGNGLLAKGAARMGYTNGVTATKWQLTTEGGQPASLPLVKAQQLVRMHGVPNEQGQPLPYVDFVIGKTTYDAGADSIGLDPVGLVARDLSTAFDLSQGAA